MRAYSIPRRLSTCKGGGITATGGNKKCFEKRKRGKIVTDGRSASGRYMSSSSSSQTDRFSALFCSLCCQFSRTLRKETNSSDFVTRLVLFPRRKERARHVPRTCGGPHPRRLLVVKIVFQKQPASDLSWIPPSDFIHSVPKIHHESKIFSLN